MKAAIVDGVAITERNRFSNFVRSHERSGMKALEGWVEWFKERGVTAVIGRTARGYAVYRNGLEELPEDE